MVRDRYDNPFEEHPGISNRNLKRVDLDVAKTLYLGDIEYRLFRIGRVNHMLIRVVPRKQCLSSLYLRDEGLFYFNFSIFGGQKNGKGYFYKTKGL